jgi:hypothetical protein
MKKSVVILPVICLVLFAIVLYGFSKPVKNKTININNSPEKKGFAVVELFTSEGCSSCPPADDAVAQLAKDYPSKVYVLGFHVDYWNYLGWKDEYSMADYSNRQQNYAGVLNLSSIYTPQVIVNGKTEFTGSDKKRLYTTVEQELNADNNIMIELSAKTSGTKSIDVSYKLNPDKDIALHIALIQLQALSAVKRGENSGKHLHHIDVVRNFKTTGSGTGSLNIILPEGLAAKDCKIIAFAQNKNDLHVTGANECSIQ